MIAGLREWIRQRWPGRGRELRRQYQIMANQCPLVLRDLAALCRAAQSTRVEGSALETHALSARREVWLHIATMTKIDPDLPCEWDREFEQERLLTAQTEESTHGRYSDDI